MLACALCSARSIEGTIEFSQSKGKSYNQDQANSGLCFQNMTPISYTEKWRDMLYKQYKRQVVIGWAMGIIGHHILSPRLSLAVIPPSGPV